MTNTVASMMAKMEAEAEKTGMALHPGYRDVSCTWDAERGFRWMLPAEVTYPGGPVVYQCSHERALEFFRNKTGLYE